MAARDPDPTSAFDAQRAPCKVIPNTRSPTQDRRGDLGGRPAGKSGVAAGPHGQHGTTPKDLPRERLARLGADALSDVELVALVLRTGDRRGDAREQAGVLLSRVGGIGGLVDTSLRQLALVPGVGVAKAASLSAAVEIAQRLRAEPLEAGKRIQSPHDVHRHFMSRLAGARRESFHVLLLDGRHRLMTEDVVSVGTLTASLVHPREVFRAAIREAAAAVLLVHNHPSGDPSPSAEDREVTDRLRAAGKVIGIEVVDHVIVAERGHYSFRESGESWASEARE